MQRKASSQELDDDEHDDFLCRLRLGSDRLRQLTEEAVEEKSPPKKALKTGETKTEVSQKTVSKEVEGRADDVSSEDDEGDDSWICEIEVQKDGSPTEDDEEQEEQEEGDAQPGTLAGPADLSSLAEGAPACSSVATPAMATKESLGHGQKRRPKAYTEKELVDLKAEGKVAKKMNLPWQERGPPPPPPGQESGATWRGQKFRKNTGKWANNGGKQKIFYNWYYGIKKDGGDPYRGFPNVPRGDLEGLKIDFFRSRGQSMPKQSGGTPKDPRVRPSQWPSSSSAAAPSAAPSAVPFSVPSVAPGIRSRRSTQ